MIHEEADYQVIYFFRYVKESKLVSQLGVPDGVECLGEIERDESDIGFRCQERAGLLEAAVVEPVGRNAYWSQFQFQFIRFNSNNERQRQT